MRFLGRFVALADKVAECYVKARGSIWWVISFNAGIVVWMIGHWLFGWDPVWVWLLLCLSVEASSSTSFLIRDQAKVEMVVDEIHVLQRKMADVLTEVRALQEQNIRMSRAILAMAEAREE